MSWYSIYQTNALRYGLATQSTPYQQGPGTTEGSSDRLVVLLFGHVKEVLPKSSFEMRIYLTVSHVIWKAFVRHF